MIQAILAVLTVAAAMGQEAPIMIMPFKSADDCSIEAAKRNNTEHAELVKATAAYVCLVVKPPMI